MNTVELYATRYNRLHPSVASAAQLFFDRTAAESFDVSRTRIKINSLISQRFAGYGIVVIGGTIHIKPGVLNCPRNRRTRNVEMDLSISHGWGTLVHELWHVWQWKRSWTRTLRDLWFEWALPGASHNTVPYEREAMLVETNAQNYFKQFDLSEWARVPWRNGKATQ